MLRINSNIFRFLFLLQSHHALILQIHQIIFACKIENLTGENKINSTILICAFFLACQNFSVVKINLDNRKACSNKTP
jgi:hypothetical protein